MFVATLALQCMDVGATNMHIEPPEDLDDDSFADHFVLKPKPWMGRMPEEEGVNIKAYATWLTSTARLCTSPMFKPNDPQLVHYIKLYLVMLQCMVTSVCMNSAYNAQLRYITPVGGGRAVNNLYPSMPPIYAHAGVYWVVGGCIVINDWSITQKRQRNYILSHLESFSRRGPRNLDVPFRDICVHPNICYLSPHIWLLPLRFPIP